MESGKLSTDAVRFFVLDEADRLLDTGNFDTIMKLFGRFPKAGSGESRLQVLFFSQSSPPLPPLGRSPSVPDVLLPQQLHCSCLTLPLSADNIISRLSTEPFSTFWGLRGCVSSICCSNLSAFVLALNEIADRQGLD